MYSFMLFCVENSPLSLFLGLEILCTGLQSCNIHDNLPDDSKSDSGDFLGAFLDGTDKQDIIESALISQGWAGLLEPTSANSERR